MIPALVMLQIRDCVRYGGTPEIEDIVALLGEIDRLNAEAKVRESQHKRARERFESEIQRHLKNLLEADILILELEKRK